MNNYTTLRNVAKMFKILAYLTVIAGLFFAGITLYANLQPYAEGGIGLLIVLGQIILYTVLIFGACMAICELIMMCIKVAEKVENMDNNLFYLASKKDEETNQ